MSINSQERQQALDAFLQKWPAERIASMTLSEYTDAGNKETLAWWLEFGQGRYLGSNAGEMPPSLVSICELLRRKANVTLSR